MNILELFKDNPTAKGVIMFLGSLINITVLQLYIFKPDIFDLNILIVFSIALSITMLWCLLNLLPSAFIATTIEGNDKPNIGLYLWLSTCIWTLLITYIGYKFKLTFNNIFEYYVLFSIVYSLITGVIDYINFNKVRKSKMVNNKQNNKSNKEVK